MARTLSRAPSAAPPPSSTARPCSSSFLSPCLPFHRLTPSARSPRFASPAPAPVSSVARASRSGQSSRAFPSRLARPSSPLSSVRARVARLLTLSFASSSPIALRARPRVVARVFIARRGARALGRRDDARARAPCRVASRRVRTWRGSMRLRSPGGISRERSGRRGRRARACAGRAMGRQA